MKIQHDNLYLTMRQMIASSPMTYDELSAKSAVPVRFIKRFKLGDIDELSTTHTLKLCRALGIRATFSTREK